MPTPPPPIFPGQKPSAVAAKAPSFDPDRLPTAKPKTTQEAMGWAVVCCHRLMGYVEHATRMSEPAGGQQIGLLESELSEALSKVRGLRKHDAAQEQTEMFE